MFLTTNWNRYTNFTVVHEHNRIEVRADYHDDNGLLIPLTVAAMPYEADTAVATFRFSRELIDDIVDTLNHHLTPSPTDFGPEHSKLGEFGSTPNEGSI